MTYKHSQPASVFSVTNNPSAQSVSTTYIEPTGSRVEIDFSGSTAKIYYKYCVYAYQSGSDAPLLHFKLQKSNDNFASDIEDVSGCLFNYSGDTEENPPDSQYKSVVAMFVVENLNKKHLRMLVRSYSASRSVSLHRSTQWDGATSADVYFNPSCICFEV